MAAHPAARRRSAELAENGQRLLEARRGRRVVRASGGDRAKHVEDESSAAAVAQRFHQRVSFRVR